MLTFPDYNIQLAQTNRLTKILFKISNSRNLVASWKSKFFPCSYPKSILWNIIYSYKMKNKPSLKLNLTKLTTIQSPVQTVIQPTPKGTPRQLGNQIKRGTLDQCFYQKLLIWEEDFFSNKLAQDHIDLLVSSYGRLVEYYDQIKDPIKYYFLEKMQFTLTRPNVIQMITTPRNQPQTMIQPKPNQTFTKYTACYSNDQSPEKSKLSSIKLQVDRSVQKTQESLRQIVQDFEYERQRAQNIHDQELRKQQMELGKKLEARKKSIDRWNFESRLQTQPDSVNQRPRSDRAQFRTKTMTSEVFSQYLITQRDESPDTCQSLSIIDLQREPKSSVF